MKGVRGKKKLWRPLLIFTGLVLGATGFLQCLTGPAAAGEEEHPAEILPASPAISPAPLPLRKAPAEIPEPLSPGEKLRHIELSGEYPEELIELARNNRETIDFVYDYPRTRDRRPPVNLSREAAGAEVPLLLQWDSRWGFLPYGDGLLADSGCGPLCLSMAALWLTKDPQWTPERVAELSESHGFRIPGSGSSWTLISRGAELVGLRAEELPLTEDTMVKALEAGKLIVLVVGPGDFTDGGHFLLVTGRQKDCFTLNDPNSRENSRRLWPYERLQPQILNLWSLEKYT